MKTVFEFGEASGYWTPVADKLTGSFWTWYLGGVIELTGIFFFAVFLVGFAVTLLCFRRKYLFLLVWLAGGYLIVTFFEAKLARYISGILPPMAIFTAIGLSKIRPRILRAITLGVLAVGVLIGFIWTSWGLTPGDPPDWLRGNRPANEVWRKAFDWSRAPEQCGDWQAARIIREIKNDSCGEEKLVFVVPYLSFFFPETFRTFVALEGIPVQVEGPGSPYAGFNYRFLIEADYLVTKSGTQIRDNLPRLDYIEPAAALLKNPPEEFSLTHETLGVFPLPDGSEATLLKRTAPAEPGERIALIHRCLEIDPDHVWAWNALGEALLETGQARKARKAFQQVIHFNPEWTGGYLGMGRT